ncbi:MAG: type I phosphomannose isomerase catalytic subunit [Candidatus Cryptobacteroides sp.]
MYKFAPILKTLVWGTESWVLSAVPGNESVVAEGPAKGKKITDIFPGQFPLLIKFIDAHDNLSIQVHPDDELARVRHNSKGKTEMWYIIGAREGAYLYSGLNRSITPQEFEELVSKDEICSVLSRYDVAAGDVFFLPAGRIHAIGAGCYLAEIQQTSDVTYRIWDYGRMGLDGKPRQLHVEESKQAIDYSVLPSYRTEYEHRSNEAVELADCPYFKTELLELDKPFCADLSASGAFQVIIALEGRSRLRSGDSEMELVPGECALLLTSEDKALEITPLDTESKLLTTHC